MVDDGDGVRFSKLSKKMDYTQFGQLYLLLSISKSTDENPIERESRCEIYSVVENCVSGEPIRL